MEALNENSPEIKVLFSALNDLHTTLQSITKDSGSFDNQRHYLTNKEVCKLLHVSERTLQEYRDKRIISYYKLEGKILYKFSDIEELLNTNYFLAWR